MDYKNGKIYQITDITYTKCYIGSTTQPLYKRFYQHKIHFNAWKKGKKPKYTSLDIFDEFGVDNCIIELIESFPCNNKEELTKREGYHIKLNECVNKCIAGRTTKEYHNDNINVIKHRVKEYYENNVDAIKVKRKKYYEDNKETIKEYKKKYYESKKKLLLP